MSHGLLSLTTRVLCKEKTNKDVLMILMWVQLAHLPVCKESICDPFAEDPANILKEHTSYLYVICEALWN